MTEKFWNFYALCYDSLRSFLPYFELQERAAEALNLREPKLRILDAGCGTGNFISTLLARNKQALIHGLDASPSMLKRAQKKAKKAGEAVRFIRADLNSGLPYKDSSFDAVISLNALYALKEPEEFIAEIRRVLKFGGLLILANPKINPKICDVFREHIRMMRKSCWKKGYSLLLCLPQLLGTLILNFFVIKQKAVKREYRFTDAFELKKLIEETDFRVLTLEEAYGGTDTLIVATKIFRNVVDGSDLFTTEVAKTMDDFTSIFRLRYDVYCLELKSLDHANYPDKEERDKYDDYSVHIIIKKGGEIVGVLRLIKDNPFGFVMEEKFSLPIIDRLKAVEHSRGIIKNEYRKSGLYALLLFGAYEWQKEHRYPICLGVPKTDSLSHILLKKGWKEIGNPAKHHGSEVVPMMYILDKY